LSYEWIVSVGQTSKGQRNIGADHLKLLFRLRLVAMRILLNLLVLFSLIGGLIAFLLRRGTPKSVFLGAIFFSTWIYIIGWWMTVGLLDQLNSNLEYGVFPYVAAMLPVVGFLGWFLRGTKNIKK
jgi:hypothetical protein